MKPIEFERVTPAEARRVLVGTPRAAAPSDWPSRRAEQKPESLLPSTMQWIIDLPAEVRPYELARAFARIANRICERWADPTRATVYLKDLMISRRSHRMGFPPKVAKEIGALNAHYDTLHPYPLGKPCNWRGGAA